MPDFSKILKAGSEVNLRCGDVGIITEVAMRSTMFPISGTVDGKPVSWRRDGHFTNGGSGVGHHYDIIDLKEAPLLDTPRSLAEVDFSDLERRVLAHMRVEKYLNTRQSSRGLDQNSIHGFHPGTDREAELRVDDLDLLLKCVTYGQPSCFKHGLGTIVYKVGGAQWSGKVVGFYSTALTPVGYAVESIAEPGSVQIYPEKALEVGDGKCLNRALEIVLSRCKLDRETTRVLKSHLATARG